MLRVFRKHGVNAWYGFEVAHRVEHPPYFASDDSALLDFDVIHGFLSACYWSPGIPRGVVEKAARNSLSFGVYERAGGSSRQVGFARVVTDRATYGYLADVFVLEEARGRGLSKLLMRCIMTHPELQGLRRWMLMTRDAHGLYAQSGFSPLKQPERAMEKVESDPYRLGG